MNHYYSKKPEVDSQQQKWQFTLKGWALSFFSDNGVFSKNRVDFGSVLLIESFALPEDCLKYGLLDMGCGYGPIGISFAKAYPDLFVEMVDVNERAIHLSKLNALENGVAKNVFIHESSLYDSVSKSDFGVILSNPPIRAGKQVVHAIIDSAYEHLIDGGRLVIVIQKKQGAPSAQKKMIEVFGNQRILAKEKGYWIIESVKEGGI